MWRIVLLLLFKALTATRPCSTAFSQRFKLLIIIIVIIIIIMIIKHGSREEGVGRYNNNEIYCSRKARKITTTHVFKSIFSYQCCIPPHVRTCVESTQLLVFECSFRNRLSKFCEKDDLGRYPYYT